MLLQAVGQAMDEGGRCHDLLREAAVDGPARELGSHAQVLLAAQAERAHPARPVQPRDADSIPGRELRATIAERVDDPDRLVAGNDPALGAKRTTTTAGGANVSKASTDAAARAAAAKRAAAARAAAKARARAAALTRRTATAGSGSICAKAGSSEARCCSSSRRRKPSLTSTNSNYAYQ